MRLAIDPKQEKNVVKVTASVHVISDVPLKGIGGPTLSGIVP